MKWLAALLVACAPPAAEKARVTISGEHVSVTPRDYRDVDPGKTLALTVIPDPSYTRSMDVGGDCPPGSWTGEVYTTGAIAESCAVSFSATINTYTVTATAMNASVSPPDRTVEAFTTASFTFTPHEGYALPSSIVTTCPIGGFSGNVYTTGPITSACDVGFPANAILTATVTGGTIDPAQPTSRPGTTTQITFTPTAGLTREDAVGGTCPAGTWDGDVYTTGTITQPCTLMFNAVP